MDNFGFTTGSALGAPAIILWGVLGALLLFWIVAAIARGRRGDSE